MTDFDVAALDAEARRILQLNDKGGYTVPTAGLYPYQWNWDSAFAALGFALQTGRTALAPIGIALGIWTLGGAIAILMHGMQSRLRPQISRYPRY